MRTFTFLIQDDRYTVPTVAFVVARDEPEARTLANERLTDSRHHRSIEVSEGEIVLFSVSR